MAENSDMIVVFIACATMVATFLGGIFAIQMREWLHLIIGFSAGAVIGVALFDLLPEAISLGSRYHSPARTAFFVAAGFLVFLILDRLVLLHTKSNQENEAPIRGTFGAGTLSAHSVLDGVAIGVGFQASPAVGIIISAAVLTHDFSDGINTVSFILKNGGSKQRAFIWLSLDAIAPVLGVASTMLFRIPESVIGLVLALFTGCFLYLGASDLIPESQKRNPRPVTTAMTLLGAGTLYVAVRLSGG
jgi:ZIP family zinc transporter